MSNSQIAATPFSAAPAAAFLPRLRDGAPAPSAADMAARQEAARERAVAAQGRFTECMEFGLTALVLAAVFLFGAALLHAGVPACQARRIGVYALYGIAGGFSAAMVVCVARGVAALGRVGRG